MKPVRNLLAAFLVAGVLGIVGAFLGGIIGFFFAAFGVIDFPQMNLFMLISAGLFIAMGLLSEDMFAGTVQGAPASTESFRSTKRQPKCFSSPGDLFDTGPFTKFSSEAD